MRVLPRFGLLVLLAAALVPALAARSWAATTATVQSAEPTTTARTLVVVADREYPPYQFVRNGQPSGFDVDLLRAVADEVGLDIEFRMLPWAEARRQLDSGEADMVAGMAHSAEREAKYVFSRPILLITIDLFVRKGSRITSADDPGVARIAVQTDGIMHDLLRRKPGRAEVLAAEDTTGVLSLLADGTVDCAFLNKGQAYFHMKEMDLPDIAPVQSVHTYKYCFAAPRGGEDLIETLDQGLALLRASGRYDEIYDEWFGGDLRSNRFRWIPPLPVVVAVVVVLLLGYAWAWSLRRTVRARTADLKRELAERHRAESELRVSKELAERLIASMKDGLVLHDPSGRVLEVNAPLCEMTAFPLAALLGAPPPQPYVPVEQRAALELLWQRALAGDFSDMEITLCRRSGERFPALVSPSVVHDADGAITGYLLTVKDMSERRRAEAALRRSEERFRMFAEAIDQAMWIVQPKPEQILYISPGCEKIWGYPQESFYRDSELWLALIHPNDREKVTQLFRDWLAGRQPDYTIEYRARRTDGEVRWLMDHGAAAHDKSGRVNVLVGITKDITPRKVAELALALGNERLGMIARSAATLVGDKPLKEMGAEMAATVRAAFGIDSCVIRIVDGRSLAYLASAGVAEEMLAPELPLNWGISGQVLQARRPLSMPDAGLAKNLPPPGDTTPPKVYAFISYAGAPLLIGGEVVGIVGIYTEHERREFTEQDLEHLQIVANHIAVAVHNDRLFREVRSQRDRLETEMAERQRLEERILKVQKLESLDILAGGIAHDFNNLLVGVLGNVTLAQDELPPDSPVRESLREMEIAARRATDLCRQMLAYAGKGRIAVEPVNLNELVSEMAHLLEISVSRDTRLKLDLAPEPPHIEADATQVRQVVMNLIINASEALDPAGGTVTLTTGTMHCDRAYLAESYLYEGQAPGTYTFVEVADTGCGMDAETLKRLFDPFFTTKFTGRGLGLAAVLGIVRGHRGAIRVSSVPDKGTRFRVLFPVAFVEAVPAEVTPPHGIAEEHRPPMNTTVLVVDDEQAVRVVAARILEKRGYRVLCAADGAEALEMVRSGEPIHCVLLDLTMPNMDGEEALRAIHAIRPEMPVIVSSGHSEQETLERFNGLRVAGYLQKPYMAARILELVSQVLGGDATPPPE